MSRATEMTRSRTGAYFLLGFKKEVEKGEWKREARNTMRPGGEPCLRQIHEKGKRSTWKRFKEGEEKSSRKGDGDWNRHAVEFETPKRPMARGISGGMGRVGDQRKERDLEGYGRPSPAGRSPGQYKRPPKSSTQKKKRL